MAFSLCQNGCRTGTKKVSAFSQISFPLIYKPRLHLFSGRQILTTGTTGVCYRTKWVEATLLRRSTLRLLIPDGNGYLGYCFFLRSAQSVSLFVTLEGTEQGPERRTDSINRC